VAKYALLNGATCVNIIEWDGNVATYNPAPLTAVLYNPAVHVVAVSVTDANRATLTTKATTALAANVTYLALATPTTAQNTTQVQQLTRECSALIRLLLGQLDDTSGT
jgi:hypothetical protein